MASGNDKVRNFWRQILSSERMAGTTFQHLRVILSLLEGGLEQFRCCMPGEASDASFYPKPRWFLPDQVTKSIHISRTPVFVEFKYSVIYSKMFFQQEITDAKVHTLYANC